MIKTLRQVLHGPPGIGKTTLAQHAKGLLWEENYIVRWRSIAVVAGQGAPALLVDILASVHEAVLTARPAFSKEEPMEAARTFRDIRDLFLVPGLHWLVVGTSDETLGILGSYPQVRSVFLPSHPPLAPLSADDFLGLLHARYAFLAENQDRELVVPWRTRRRWPSTRCSGAT